MISDESILCFAPEPWEHIWRNRHQIMSRLAEKNRVLFVEPRPYLREVIRDWRAGKVGWKDLSRPLVTQIKENLWAYHPPLFAPLSGRYPLSVILRWLRETQMKRVMRQLGFTAPILWLYRPNMADAVGRYGEKLVTYHIVDQYSAYEADFQSVYGQERRSSVEQSERTMLGLADLVIVTSSSLLEEKGHYNANTHWVPNGVDYEAFSTAALSGALPPDDVAALPRPIVGYVGAINEKLDYELLRQVALEIPCTLILVGPVHLRLDLSGPKMLDLPNVCFLGAKPVSDVARYVAACDVCLMPYKLNEWTAHINPLKLYEYLAAGKPVVSTAIPATAGFEQVIRIAGGQAGFCQHVGHALEERDASLVRDRMNLAAQNTWMARVEKLSELVEASLSG